LEVTIEYYWEFKFEAVIFNAEDVVSILVLHEKKPFASSFIAIFVPFDFQPQQWMAI